MVVNHLALINENITKRMTWFVVLAVGTMAAVRPGNTYLITDRAEIAPLRVVVQDYLREHEFAPANTLRAKTQALEDFQSFMAKWMERSQSRIVWADVSKQAIEAYRDALIAHDLSANTVRQRLAILKHLSKQVSGRFTILDRAESVRLPVSPTPQFRALTESQYRSIMDCAAAAPPRDRYCVELLALSGMRREESVNITLGQISDDWRYFVGG